MNMNGFAGLVTYCNTKVVWSLYSIDIVDLNLLKMGACCSKPKVQGEEEEEVCMYVCTYVYINYVCGYMSKQCIYSYYNINTVIVYIHMYCYLSVTNIFYYSSNVCREMTLFTNDKGLKFDEDFD